MKRKLSIVQCSFHRNGISGNGFYAVLFDWKENGEEKRMLAIIFDEPGSCAVLEVSQLSEDTGVKFGYNSWRGDHFEGELREMIKKQESNRVGPFSLPEL